MLDIRNSSKNMMHLRCQFCDSNPGYLRAFGKHDAWACMSCLYHYGLEDHELVGNEIVAFDAEAEFNATNHISSHTNYYSIWKPRRSIVKIEEIPFSGDLADATSFYLFNL